MRRCTGQHVFGNHAGNTRLAREGRREGCGCVVGERTACGVEERWGMVEVGRSGGGGKEGEEGSSGAGQMERMERHSACIVLPNSPPQAPSVCEPPRASAAPPPPAAAPLQASTCSTTLHPHVLPSHAAHGSVRLAHGPHCWSPGEAVVKRRKAGARCPRREAAWKRRQPGRGGTKASVQRRFAIPSIPHLPTSAPQRPLKRPPSAPPLRSHLPFPPWLSKPLCSWHCACCVALRWPSLTPKMAPC